MFASIRSVPVRPPSAALGGTSLARAERKQPTRANDRLLPRRGGIETREAERGVNLGKSQSLKTTGFAGAIKFDRGLSAEFFRSVQQNPLFTSETEKNPNTPQPRHLEPLALRPPAPHLQGKDEMHEIQTFTNAGAKVTTHARKSELKVFLGPLKGINP